MPGLIAAGKAICESHPPCPARAGEEPGGPAQRAQPRGGRGAGAAGCLADRAGDRHHGLHVHAFTGSGCAAPDHQAGPADRCRCGRAPGSRRWRSGSWSGAGSCGPSSSTASAATGSRSRSGTTCRSRSCTRCCRSSWSGCCSTSPRGTRTRSTSCRRKPQVVVNVTGFQWSWQFQYPQYAVKNGGADGGHRARARCGTRSAGRTAPAAAGDPRARDRAVQPELDRRDPLVLDGRRSTSSATSSLTTRTTSR